MLKNLLVLTVLWAAMNHQAQAAKVRFGETVVDIPAPVGFVQGGEESGRLPGLSARLGGSEPIKTAFVPKEAGTATADGLPGRVAAVFAIDKPVAGGVSSENFATLVASSQSNETLEALKAHMELMTAPVIGAPPGSKEQKPVPTRILPPHIASDRHIALSMRRTGKTIGPGGVPAEHKAAYTTAFVVVRGMVIRLMVQSESDGVDWTRETCRAWAEAIITENPAEPGSASAFSIDAPVEAFDRFMADLPIKPIVAQARTIPWLGTLSPSALNAVLGVAALIILIFAMALILKIFRRLRG